MDPKYFSGSRSNLPFSLLKPKACSSCLVPNCPFNLISLSQLNKSLNCSITFVESSLQEQGTYRFIGKGHESRRLYYLCSIPSMSCLASPSPKLLNDH